MESAIDIYFLCSCGCMTVDVLRCTGIDATAQIAIGCVTLYQNDPEFIGLVYTFGQDSPHNATWANVSQSWEINRI